MQNDRQTHRKAEVRCSEDWDGEASVPWELRILTTIQFNREWVCSIHLNSGTGLANLSRSSLSRGAVFRL